MIKPVFTLDARLFLRNPSDSLNYLAYVTPLWWQVWLAMGVTAALGPLTIYAATQAPPKVIEITIANDFNFTN